MAPATLGTGLSVGNLGDHECRAGGSYHYQSAIIAPIDPFTADIWRGFQQLGSLSIDFRSSLRQIF